MLVHRQVETMHPTFTQQGFSLVELMISLGLSVAVIGFTLSMYTTTVGTNASAIRAIDLNQELRAAMNLISRDLARAGSWGFAKEAIYIPSITGLTLGGTSGSVTATVNANALATSFNPESAFQSNMVGLQIRDPDSATNLLATVTAVTNSSQFTVTITNANTNAFAPSDWQFINPFQTITVTAPSGNYGNCITFAYDRPQTGNNLPNGTVQTNEQLGYRLNTVDKTLEARSGAAACSAGGWESFTNSDLFEITAFTITSEVSCNNGMTLRGYNLSIAGRVKNDTAVTRSVQKFVRVRNNNVNAANAAACST